MASLKSGLRKIPRKPHKMSSNRHETLRKRVSDDSPHFIFRLPIFFCNFFGLKNVFRDFREAFEKLWPNGPQDQLQRQILL